MIDLYIDKEEMEIEVKGTGEEIIEETSKAAYNILRMVDCPLEKSIAAVMIALLGMVDGKIE